MVLNLSRERPKRANMKTTVSLVGRVGSAEILAVIQEQIKKVYMVQDKKSGQCEDYMDIDMKRADVSYN